MAEIKNIIASLGLNEKNGLFFVEDSHWKTKTSFPNRVKRLIEYKIKPKAFFCFDNKPLLLSLKIRLTRKNFMKPYGTSMNLLLLSSLKITVLKYIMDSIF